jgi:hypothetical protein
MRSEVEKLFRVQGEPQVPPVMLQDNNFRPHYDDHPHFYISLQMKNKNLNNYMLDSGAGANVMALKVMRKLGLESTRPYRNFHGIESKAIPTYGVIEILKVFLDQYPEIVFLMNIVVTHVLDVWGMLLSRNFVAILGGTLQMDLTYGTIPMDDETYSHLPNLPMARNHVEGIDLDPDIEDPLEDFPENFKYSPLKFFPNDLHSDQEDDTNDIVGPKREYYQQKLDRYKDKVVDSITILKKGDK